MILLFVRLNTLYSPILSSSYTRHISFDTMFMEF